MDIGKEIMRKYDSGEFDPTEPWDAWDPDDPTVIYYNPKGQPLGTGLLWRFKHHTEFTWLNAKYKRWCPAISLIRRCMYKYNIRISFCSDGFKLIYPWKEKTARDDTFRYHN